MSEPKITITMPHDAAEATLQALRDIVGNPTHNTANFVAILKAAAALTVALQENEE